MGIKPLPQCKHLIARQVQFTTARLPRLTLIDVKLISVYSLYFLREWSPSRMRLLTNVTLIDWTKLSWKVMNAWLPGRSVLFIFFSLNFFISFLAFFFNLSRFFCYVCSFIAFSFNLSSYFCYVCDRFSED